MIRLLLVYWMKLLAILAVFQVKAQLIEPIKWSFRSEQSGAEVKLIFKAIMDKGWHLYDTRLPEGGPIPTQFTYEDSTLFEFAGELQKTPEPVEHFDKTFEMNEHSESHVFM